MKKDYYITHFYSKSTNFCNRIFGTVACACLDTRVASLRSATTSTRPKKTKANRKIRKPSEKGVFAEPLENRPFPFDNINQTSRFNLRLGGAPNKIARTMFYKKFELSL